MSDQFTPPDAGTGRRASGLYVVDRELTLEAREVQLALLKLNGAGPRPLPAWGEAFHPHHIAEGVAAARRLTALPQGTRFLVSAHTASKDSALVAYVVRGA